MATIKNAAANLAGKTLLKAEDSQPVTGLKTFLRAPLAPFGVEASSAVVPNLDADLLDGEHGADYHDAAQLTGTVPAAAIPDPLPARSAENLVNIPSANLTGPVPAASLLGLAPIVQVVSDTGTVNDLALNDETTDLLCTNASALVLTGLAGGSAGRRIWVHAAGAGSVKVAHQGAGSAEANRAIGVSTAGQILGQGGLLLLVYDGAAARWRIYLVEPGAPIAFTPSIGGVGGQVGQTYSFQVARYVQRGREVHVQGRIDLTAVGTIVGQAQIQGLPITAAGLYCAAMVRAANLATAIVSIEGEVRYSTTAIDLYRRTAAAASAAVAVQADFAVGSYVTFNANYLGV